MAFGFHYVDLFGGKFHKKVRVIVGDVAVGIYIVQFEVDCEVILAVGHYVCAVFQKAREKKLEMTIADDAVEDAFLWDQIGLVLCNEWPGLAQFYGVADFCVAAVPHR